jgi:tRNA(Ile)-lysidine synthase
MSSFSAHIQHALEKNVITQSQRVIVAVSGGADSMALLHACVSLHYDCVAAHVNYGLRGADSDADEMCVRNYCTSANIPIEILRVKKEHWDNNPGSTQEAARNIRYTWFNELLKQHEASCIVTAHHAKDQLETMLQQFIRGGGGKSLYGMAIRQGAVVRPMLSFSKEEVLEYAEANHIAWRNDASNETDDYTRNLIRHQIIPVIEELNSSIYKGIQQRSEWMHQEQAASNDAVNSFLAKHLVHEGEAPRLTMGLFGARDPTRVLLPPHGLGV